MARYGLVYNIIYSIAQNQEGTIWLGTDKGVFYFNPEKQRFFPVNAFPGAENNTIADAVSGFWETRSGEIWVNSINQGLRVYNQRFQLLRTYNQPPANKKQIRYVLEDNQRQVWAGGEGVLLLIKNAQSPVQYFRPPVLAGQVLVKAAIDSAGTIWWGTQAGLLVRHQPATNRLELVSLKEQLGEQETGQIKRILCNPDGTLWVATTLAGVLHVNARSGKILAHYTTATRPQGLLSNETGEMIRFNDTTLVISTSQGLHFLNPKNNKITYYTTAEGLPANAILNVIKASEEHLFLTTQFSLSRWSPETRMATNYGVHDGLVNESYAFNTGYRLRDGRILIATLQGFYYFHPDSLITSEPPPAVQITGFRIFDQNIPIQPTALKNEGVHLAYNQNFFTIEFASLNYYDDNKINYEYQLEGVDPGWRNAGRNRFANYTNLDGGTYRFKVMARLEDDTTNQQITTLNLTIAKPFWKTGWFLALVFILLAALGNILYNLRVQRLLALQQVRSRIARDLHDDMGSTLSTITIFSDLAKQQVLANPTLAQGYLQKISRYSHQMMTAMDDIVWSINPHNDSLQNLTSRMREVATEVLEAKNMPFCIQTDPALNAVRLPLESRYDCFMIFKEALNNIAKYANCSQVWIKVAISDHRLQVEITDNGQGFDIQSANTGNGLLNMQKRAQTIKGHLQIKSVPGQGTTILLTAPLSKLSFKPVRV